MMLAILFDGEYISVVSFPEFLPVLLTLSAIVLQGAGIFYAGHAVMVSRTPQTAISWGISLLVFPLVAIPLYWIFGESTLRGYTTVGARHSPELVDAARTLRAEAAPFTASFDSKYLDAQRVAMSLTGVPAVGGNALGLLIDGEETFDAIFRAIGEAREYVVVQFYIVHDDGLGNRLRRSLVEAAARGVRCYLLYDDVGSKGLSRSWVAELRRAGVETEAFVTNRQHGMRFQLNFRNHRKLVVVDGRVSFLGGLNAGDEYLGLGPLGDWRDTHVRVEGPAVALQLIPFLEDWHYATGRIPRVSSRPVAAGERRVLPFASGPVGTWHVAQAVYHELIHDARDRLWIASPYFVPDPPTRSALAFAALRGVDVRILLPGKPDHILPWLTSFTLYPQMQEAGVRIWRHQRGFMHQKVLLADDDFAIVGSVNLDSRSFGINFEAAIASPDRHFALEVEEMLTRDFANSTEEDLSSFEKRAFAFRFACRLASLLSPEQ